MDGRMDGHTDIICICTQTDQHTDKCTDGRMERAADRIFIVITVKHKNRYNTDTTKQV